MTADHNGVCGFCGSPVPRGFTVCANCGAVWQKVQIGMGGFLFDASRGPVTLGIFGGAAWFFLAHNPLGLVIAAAALGLGFLLMMSSKSYRWVRRQP